MRGLGERATWLAGVVVALVGVAVGCAVAWIPAVVVWMSSPTSGLAFLQTLRIAGLLWLVGEGSPVTMADATYSLTPWGLAVLPIAALVIASRLAARRMTGLPARLWLVLATAATYGIAMGVVGWFVSGDDASVPFVISGIMGVVIALVACGAGVFVDQWARLPIVVSRGLRASVVALCALVVMGALAVAASLVVHIDDAITIARALDVGVLGGIGVLVVSLAYVPVLIVWGLAYVLGAGVVLGPLVTASPFTPVMAPAPLPPLPILAAIPQQASPILACLPVLGVAAAVLAGLSLGRRMRESSWLQRLAAALVCSVCVGLVLGVVGMLASGSLGSVRFAHLGPPAATLAGIGLVLTFIGAAPVAIFAVPRRRRPEIVPVPDRAPDRTSVVIVQPERPWNDTDMAVDDADATVGMAPLVMDDEPTVGLAPIVDDDDATVAHEPVMWPDHDPDATTEIPAIDMAQSPHE